MHHGLIFDAARLVKEGRDRLVGHRLDPIDAEQRRLPAERLNLLHEPLKKLRGLWSLGQDPRGSPELDRPHALELSPDPYAVSCRSGRQGGEERQPPHIPTVTLATPAVKRYTPFIFFLRRWTFAARHTEETSDGKPGRPPTHTDR